MRRKLGAIAIALYVISLLLPAIVIVDRPLFGSGGGHEQMVLGIQCLVYGFFVWPGWLANPLLFVAVVVRTLAVRPGWYSVATILAYGATISAISAPFLLAGIDVLDFVHVHVGYVLWLGACVTAALEMHVATLEARDAIALANAARLEA